LAVLSIESPETPLSQLMREDRRKLKDKGYPATQVLQSGDGGEKSPLNSATRAKAARWIDGLDRI
jgi:hypothetical protein